MVLEVPQHGGGCRFAEIRVFTRVLTARKMCISSNAFFVDTPCCKTRSSGGLRNAREFDESENGDVR